MGDGLMKRIMKKHSVCGRLLSTLFVKWWLNDVNIHTNLSKVIHKTGCILMHRDSIKLIKGRLKKFKSTGRKYPLNSIDKQKGAIPKEKRKEVVELCYNSITYSTSFILICNTDYLTSGNKK